MAADAGTRGVARCLEDVLLWHTRHGHGALFDLPGYPQEGTIALLRVLTYCRTRTIIQPIKPRLPWF